MKRICFILVIVAVLSCNALSHGTRDYITPSEEQIKQIAAPIPGAHDFVLEVADQSRDILVGGLYDLFDEVVGLYAHKNKLEAEHGSSYPDSEYYRWQAEEHLLELVEDNPNLIEIAITPKSSNGFTDRVLKFAGHRGNILLKVVTSDNAKKFSIQKLDIRREGPPEKTPVEILGDGTTYILLQLDEIPSNDSTFNIAIKAEDAAHAGYWHGFAFERKPLGQFSLNISDEKGFTPALVRITEKSSGRLWEPPNAVDLAPIMHDITSPGMTDEVVKQVYGPGRGFRYYVPGKFKGRYWVVPEPFEMALPAGEYELYIHHGLEHIPVIDTFKISEGKWTKKNIKLKRFANMASRGWYSGDDHIHSRMMDSVDADKLIACVKATNINLANILEMGDAVRSYYNQRGFGKEFRVIEGDHILVPGQEDPRSQLGHVIGMNIKSLVRDLDRYLRNDWIADEMHRQGGLYGITHVGAMACFAERDMALTIPEEKVDFNSILQIGLGTDWYYDFLNLGYRIVASAGSDTPYGGSPGSVRVYSYLGKKKFTADAWFDAFEKGNTFVTNGPMLEFTVNGKMPGEEIIINGKKTLRVKAKSWGIAGDTAATTLRIVMLGKTVKEVYAGPNDDSLEIEIDIPVEFGGWVAAHAIGGDGMGAHTTPVYVQRKGYRHWNVDKAEAIIDRQLGIIDVVDGLVDEAEKMKADGRLSKADLWHGRMVDQAGYVRKRNKRVRGIYEGLRKTLKKEVGERSK